MKSFYKLIKYAVGIGIACSFIWFIATGWDGGQFFLLINRLVEHPFIILTGTALYGMSFYMKGIAMKILLRHSIRLSSAMYGLWYSLALNHLLPVKAGDIVRSYIFFERENLSKSVSAQSVIIVRLMDIFSLFILVSLGMTFNFLIASPLILTVAGAAGILAVVLVFLFKREFIIQQWKVLVSLSKGREFFYSFVLIFISWVLEAALLLSVCIAAAADISVWEAIWVNSLTILGQVFQITPGGVANYEPIMAFGLSRFNIPWNEGLQLAIVTHLMKFLISYAAGIYALIRYPITFKKLTALVKERRDFNEKRI
jgi:glycosyltransferase AglD